MIYPTELTVFTRFMSDSGIYIRMADIISHIVAKKPCNIADCLLFLLCRLHTLYLIHCICKEIVYMAFMHIGAYIPVVSVSQYRYIIKEHIRTLQPKLIQPSVFGDDML